jgi:adenosyl cobinamide kinase/adenosyl cobinamide phosphate guanylyltransferase
VITLVLGGARSGKSAVAERLAAATSGPVIYLATAAVDGDADLAARVERHRRRRPSTWTTVEAADDLGPQLRALDGTVLLDALGPWVARHLDGTVAPEALAAALVDALAARRGDTIVVSEEVGLGVHPSTDVGRRFRDLLGVVNQAVAAAAGDVLLVVAGRVLPLGAV